MMTLLLLALFYHIVLGEDYVHSGIKIPLLSDAESTGRASTDLHLRR